MLITIRVLIWADVLAFYTLWLMMTYLTEVWKLSVKHAAGIINIWGGIVLILPIGSAHIADTLVGKYGILALSSISYSVGLGFLSMSTPPVLGTCSEYEPKCIGDTQKALFYTALALLAIGMSGHIVYLRLFLMHQEYDQSAIGRRRIKKRKMIMALFTLLGAIALPYIKPWSIKFGIPAIFTVVATILFLCGSRFYDKFELEGSPLTKIFRAIRASASKIFKRQGPSRKEDFFDRDNITEDELRSYLDKSHVIKDQNEERNRWRLCVIAKVKAIKTVFLMIPIWMTFLLCGLVSSAGDTYFQEQANNLSRSVGKLKVPLTILLILQQYAKSIFSKISKSLKESLRTLGLGRYAALVSIAGAMTFATLSCITAAKVEARRLSVIRSHDLTDKPEDTIPMNIFWVLPQFVLLGGLESFLEHSITDYINNLSLGSSMAKYLDHFILGVSGLGYMASVLLVHVVGKISERGGKPNWFQYTLNTSRLDNYYWTLSALCAANLVACFLVTNHEEPTSDDDDEQLEIAEFDELFGDYFK